MSLKSAITNRTFVRILIFVGAALVGGVAGTLAVSEDYFLQDSSGVDSHEVELLRRKVMETARKSAAVRQARTSGQKIPPPRRWTTGIARNDPSRSFAVKVSKVRPDGSLEAEKIGRRAARTGLGTTFAKALRKVAAEHGLELKVVSDLTEIANPLFKLIAEYNDTAHDMDYEQLDPLRYISPFVSNYKWSDTKQTLFD